MRLSGVLFVVVVLGVAGSAVAQDSTLEGEARALFEAGAAAYAGGRYAEAVRYFQRSYELSGRAELLNNIGSAAERDRQDELALRSYEQFLERVPDTPIRARVERRIDVLRRALEAPSASPSAAEVTPARVEIASPVGARGSERGSERGSDGAGPAPWILVGVGAAVAVAGGVLLGVGLADREAVERPGADPVWTDATQASYERGPALLVSGAVSLPVGLVAAAAGVVWAVVDASGGEATVALGLGSIHVSGRF